MPVDSTYHKYYDALQGAYGKNGSVEPGSFTLGYDDFKAKLANQSYAQKIYGALSSAYGSQGKAEPGAFTLSFDAFNSKLSNRQPAAIPPTNQSPNPTPTAVTTKTAPEQAAIDLHDELIGNKDLVPQIVKQQKVADLYNTAMAEHAHNLSDMPQTDIQRLRALKDQPKPTTVSADEVNAYTQNIQNDDGAARSFLGHVAKLKPEKANKIKAALYTLDATTRNPNDPAIGSKIADNANKIRNGELDYNIQGSQLLKPENFIESAVTGWKAKNKALNDFEVFNHAKPEDAIAELERRRAAYDPNNPTPVPEGIGGRLTEGLASQPLKGLLIGKGAGTVTGLIPGVEEFAPAVDKFVSTALSANDFRKMSYANGLQKYYNQLRNQGLGQQEAYQKASSQADEESLIDAGANAAMMYVGGKIGDVQLPSFNASALYKTALVNGLKQVGKIGGEAGAIGLIQGAAQDAKNNLAAAKGIDVDHSGQDIQDAAENGAMFTLGVAVLAKGAGKVASSVRSGLLYGLSKVPVGKVDAELGEQIINGNITPGEAVGLKNEIDNHAKIDQSIPDHISEATRTQISGQIKDREQLEQELESKDKAYHPEIKDKIKAINDSILALSSKKETGTEQIDKNKAADIKDIDAQISELDKDKPSYDKDLESLTRQKNDIQDYYDNRRAHENTENAFENVIKQSKSISPTYLLSRHADTIKDEQNKISSDNQHPLSEKGIKDANDLADEVKKQSEQTGIPVTKIVTTGLERSKETGEKVAEKIGAKIVNDPALNTWATGEFDNTKDEDWKRIQKWFVEHPNELEYKPEDKGDPFYGKKLDESFDTYANKTIAAHKPYESEPLSTLMIDHSNNMMVMDAYRKNGNQWNDEARLDYLNADKPEPATLTNRQGSYPKVTNVRLKPIDNLKPEDNAIQERRPAEVLQRESGNDGETGSGRGRMEPIQQGNEPAGESIGQPVANAPTETKESTGQESAKGNVAAPPEKGEDWPFVDEAGDDEFTSIRNAVTEQKIQDYGLMPAMKEAKREFGTVWNEAIKKINNGVYDIVKDLIKPLVKKQRPLTDLENAMLLYHQNIKEAALAEASKGLDKARLEGDRENISKFYNDRAKLLDDLQEIYNVDRAVGTLNARGLASRKMMADRRFSLVNMQLETQASNGGDRLTQEQFDKVQKQFEDIKRTKDEYERALKKLKSENESLLAEKTLKKESASSKKKTVLKEKSDKIKSDLSGNVKELKDILKEQRKRLSANPIPVEALPVIAKMAKNVFKLGVIGIENISDTIYEAIKDEFQGLSKDHVKEALIASIDKSKQESYKTGSIELLSDFRKSGMTSENISELYKDLIAKRAKYFKSIDDYESGLKQAEEKERSRWQKAMDYVVKWERGFKLSNPITLAKLSQAALIRMAQTPLESTVGGVYSAIFQKLAAKAEGEGGLNVAAAAKAYKASLMNLITDAGAVMKKGNRGKGELDYAFGKMGQLPPEAIDFFGHLHSSIKAPVKRFAFERSLEKRLQKNINNGVDVTDPAVAQTILLSAYKDANRAIFMQDNAVSRAYQGFITNLERDKKNPGFTNATAATLKFLIPFVKVPTNIVGEVGQHVAGVPISVGQAIYYAFKKGLSNLSADEADSIMRNMKKGTIGTGALLLGYYHPNDFGGYYNPEDKKRPKDLKPGEMRLFGKRIPLWALEAPVFQAMQVGATIRRMSDIKERHEARGLALGTIDGMLGFLEKEPLLEEPTALLGAAAKPGTERNYFLSSLAKSTMDPALLDWIAKMTDPADKRSPSEKLIYPDEIRQPDKKHGTWKQVKQTVETGIPGLREKVPLKHKK